MPDSFIGFSQSSTKEITVTQSTHSTMAQSPVGIEISKGKRKWKIGKVLGSGACATVCALKYMNSGICEETDYAVKLAPLAKKKTRKGNSPEEMNEKLLYYEQLVYTTQFRSLQGVFIPSAPSASSKDPPIYGDEKGKQSCFEHKRTTSSFCFFSKLSYSFSKIVVQTGFRYFVMERMDSTISSIVPLLLKKKTSSKTLNIGEICVKLLECVRAVHETKNIIRDVKAENFMLTPAAKASGSTVEGKLASRIRLIDLAMATQWTSMYKETDSGDCLIGTPFYASLNLHSGKKSAFRDDLESLGYVIAEILTQLYCGDSSKQLPWSHGKSDDEIGAIKRSLVEDETSGFYVEMGNAKTIAVFSEYMEIVRGYKFKTLPDYDRLSKVLSKLTVPCKKLASAPSSRSKTSRSATTSTKRMRSNTKSSNTDFASPPKVARRCTRSTKSMDTENTEGRPTSDPYESFDETVYADAHQDLEEMDWEYSVDENEAPKTDSKPRAKTKSSNEPAIRRQRTTRSGKAPGDNVLDSTIKEKEKLPIRTSGPLKCRGISILCVEGPHEGESYDLEAGVTETVVIGSKPSSSVGEVWRLEKDKKLQATHVRFDLSTNRKLTALKVIDKSKGETFVNRLAVKNTKAFINDIIKIGDSSFKVKTL